MIEIGGAPLTTTQVCRIALQHEPITLTQELLDRVDYARRSAEAVVTRRVVYGRSTGVGANRVTTVDPDDEHIAMRLLRSHAVDGGQAVPASAVRAMIAIRVAQLGAGGAGVRGEVLEGLVAMLNQGTLPEVHSFGSIGTGDLAALAGTALTLAGERPAAGGVVSPLVTSWDVHDALPFISSNALTLGRAVLVESELRRLLRATVVIAALSATALRVNVEALTIAAATAVGQAGSLDVTEALRELVEGSAPAVRLQDPYALRVLPQTLGPLLDEQRLLRSLLEDWINAAQENPLILTGATHEDADVIHHGGFHAAPLALRADTLAIALAAAHTLTLRRLSLLTDPSMTERAPFLAVGPPGASGVMMLEYVATAALATVRASAQPASIQTAVLSLATEEDASFAPLAVQHLEQSAAAVRELLACELLTAVRALRMAGTEIPPALGHAWALTEQLPTDLVDHDLRPDLEIARVLVDQVAETTNLS